ncbi:STAS domain-containing protein [Massilia litorea]|uniref:STAS domain-containing protein n=1 Tax=Massilia litorea TaxID=2769491 RepID=A0A7L9U870_9BURK|nr:STAS domain-containing protein [Massilia litorea]QOL51040.1 STAS domain-containing protein [Massilia litorea]
MGIFSFLKKKPEPAAAPVAPARLDEPARLSLDADRERQREIARATAAKIDAIELAMTTDFFDDAEARWGNTRRVPAAAAAAGAPGPEAPGETEPVTQLEQPDAAAAPAAAPVVEESAILYANGQATLAEQMLRASLADLGRSERQPWWMLFDLYQAAGREQDFDSIAIDYASHFETSPPAYSNRLPADSPQEVVAGLAPAARFTGTLDQDAKLRLHALGASAGSPVRIDVAGITHATLDGCAALLAALQDLRAARRDVVLAGADVLLAVLRPMLAIGERGSGEAPWLLLLEVLQLAGREKDFEETAMDYCVTFEVSPPSFEALPSPKGGAGTAAHGAMAAEQRFMLPAVVEGDIRNLLEAIESYAAMDPRAPVVLDCARLVRIEFAAAASLHATLRRLAADERRIELRELNHLVAALLRLLNYGDCARLYAHKY